MEVTADETEADALILGELVSDVVADTVTNEDGVGSATVWLNRNTVGATGSLTLSSATRLLKRQLMEDH